MDYINYYDSPLGKILLASDNESLKGLWFENQKHYKSTLKNDFKEKSLKIFDLTKNWLDIYFKGNEPDFSIPVSLIGSDFQLLVWEILKSIPYSKTITYSEIAKLAAKKRGLAKMSSRAVGSAIGKNPISIIVPCHRVISKTGALTGYAGGIERKKELLKLENVIL